MLENYLYGIGMFVCYLLLSLISMYCVTGNPKKIVDFFIILVFVIGSLLVLLADSMDFKKGIVNLAVFFILKDTFDLIVEKFLSE